MRQHKSFTVSARFLLFLISGYFSVVAHGSAEGLTLSILSQKPIVIYNGIASSCGKYDGVDAPARAFRDNKGLVHLFASDNHNTQFIGPSLLTVHHTCESAFEGARNADPAAYDDEEWLTSFYTFDGRNVFALVHNEYEGAERPAVCPRKGPECWEISLVSAFSKDAGLTFARTAGADAVVAAYPYGYDPGRSAWYGYLNPTNIIEKDGYYYVFFGFKDPINKVSGVSAMRTHDLFDAGSWRGWGGLGFTVPMKAQAAGTHMPPVMPIADGNTLFTMGSVSFHAPSGTYIAILRMQFYGKPRAGFQQGIYYSTSKDLTNWSPPRLLLADADAEGVMAGAIEFYPTLLDPASSDRNFSEVGSKPYLLTVRYVPGVPIDKRQLVAWPIDIEG